MIPSGEDPPDARRLDAQLLSDLWVFRAAARMGSLTGAASRLGVSQGAVSQRILRLEGRLGVQLFSREKGRVTLTSEGESVFEAMSQVAMILNETLGAIEPRHRSALVVRCVPSVATEWLVPNLQDFYTQHPGIEIFVRAELAPSTPERLDDESIDLAIDYCPEPVPDLHELASLQEFVFPVCSPRYRARLPDVDPVLLTDDLDRLGRPADYEWETWRRTLDTDWPGKGAASRHFYLAHLAYHAAMGDQGVALGRAVIMHRLLAKGELIPATDSAPVPGAVYRLLTNRPGKSTSAMRLFATWCVEAMTETQNATLALLAAGPRASDWESAADTPA